MSKILVWGATGKQGSAVVNALSDSTSFEILAVTRDPNSPASQGLAKKPHVTVVQGDWAKPKPLFNQHNDIWGMFLVLAASMTEVDEAKACIDAAKEAGVQHIIYSSQSLQEYPDNMWIMPKRLIEEYLIASGIKYTILRPAGLLETHFWPPFRQMTKAVYKPSDECKVLSAIDVGKVAALVFKNPVKYSGEIIELAGENAEWRTFLPKLEKKFGPVDAEIPEWIPKPFVEFLEFVQGHNFNASVEACKKRFPFMMTIDQWMETIPVMERQETR